MIILSILFVKRKLFLKSIDLFYCFIIIVINAFIKKFKILKLGNERIL